MEYFSKPICTLRWTQMEDKGSTVRWRVQQGGVCEESDTRASFKSLEKKLLKISNSEHTAGCRESRDSYHLTSSWTFGELNLVWRGLKALWPWSPMGWWFNPRLFSVEEDPPESNSPWFSLSGHDLELMLTLSWYLKARFFNQYETCGDEICSK